MAISLGIYPTFSQTNPCFNQSPLGISWPQVGDGSCSMEARKRSEVCRRSRFRGNIAMPRTDTKCLKSSRILQTSTNIEWFMMVYGVTMFSNSSRIYIIHQQRSPQQCDPPQELEFSEQNSSAAMDSVRSVHPSDVSWGVDPGTLWCSERYCGWASEI